MMASVQVLKPDPADKHRFVLDEERLREILVANPAVRDNPVIVISVAGRYRTGKSFLLSLMHRYLSIHYTVRHQIIVLISSQLLLQESKTSLHTFAHLALSQMPDHT